jgi:hypothetical protein
MTNKPNGGQHETEPAADPRVDQALGIFSDLKTLEVSPTAQIGAREILSTVAVRKPKNNEFIRVRDDLDFTLTTIVYENKDEGETYLVVPEMRPAMIAGLATRLLVLAVNQVGAVFIWPVPIDDEYSRKNAWNESARSGYHKAKTDWVKLVGDRAAGHYRLYLAEGVLPAPRWPDKTFGELLAIAFGGRQIASENHPVVRSMRGLTV